MKTFPLLPLFGALALSLVPVPKSSGATIVSDSFTGTNGAAINGRTPDTTDLPGVTWQSQSQGNSTTFSTITTAAGNPAPAASTNFNSGNALSIGSAGSYTKPAMLTLTADLSVNTLNGSPANGAGLGLGYYSALPATGSNAYNNFTGFLLNYNNGASTLNLIAVSGAGTITSLGSVSLTENLGTSTFYRLSYSVNTTTGALQSVVFDGNNYTANFTTTAFTNAATNLVGFYGANPFSTSLTGYVDNFQLASVPEPASGWLLGGALVVLAVGRRVRKHARC